MKGQFITFDADLNTAPTSVNPSGAITGYCFDASGVYHGFVRAPDGTITTFDAPGPRTAYHEGTVPNSINPAGEVSGLYYDASSEIQASRKI